MSLREMLAGGGGLKSFQTGYVSTTSVSTGSGEDLRYIDITISSVNVAKADPTFIGGVGQTSAYSARSTSGPQQAWIPTCRLTSPTNLRVSLDVDDSSLRFTGRWKVVESK